MPASISVSKKQYNNKAEMLQEKVKTLFKDSTQMYCQGNYQACLALLSDCIALEIDKSILYSNRSIANYHLNQMEKAFEDLDNALRTSHLNYIAYFNLFSLHFINGNQPQSFKNLCLCLSSAYTVLCRYEASLEWAEHSLRYSFNNKQSIFLKAMIIYQKNQLRASLQLLRKVQQLQNKPEHRQGVIKYIHAIQNQLGLDKSHYESNSVMITRFFLQTDRPVPEETQFDAQISKMLKEFNDIYRKLNDQLQIGHQLKENLSSLISERSEDKEVNRHTAQNSTALSRNVQHEELRSVMELSRNKELRLLQRLYERTKQQEQIQNQRLSFNDSLYPVKKVDQKIRFFILQATLNISINEYKEKNENIYAILSYKQGKESFEHRTSVSDGNLSSFKWQEWTDGLFLTPEASDLEIKILSKRFTAFKDDLLAQGQFQVSKYGTFKIPLFSKDECNGQIKLVIQVE